MVVLNYTCLKLKMPGPCGIITISASFRVAYTYEQANCELASMLAGLQEPRTKAAKEAPPSTSPTSSRGNGSKGSQVLRGGGAELIRDP
jgi:hypothetical protein